MSGGWQAPSPIGRIQDILAICRGCVLGLMLKTVYPTLETHCYHCYISLWLYILFRIKSLINFLPPKFFRRSSVTCSWEALWASDKMAALMHCTADMIFLGWLIPLLLCLRQKACGEFMTLVLVICSSLHERPIKTSCKSDLTSHHWSQQEDYGHIFYRLEWKSGSAWIHRSPKLLFEETVQKRFTWTRKRCRTIEVEEIWVKASPQ